MVDAEAAVVVLSGTSSGWVELAGAPIAELPLTGLMSAGDAGDGIDAPPRTPTSQEFRLLDDEEAKNHDDDVAVEDVHTKRLNSTSQSRHVPILITWRLPAKNGVARMGRRVRRLSDPHSVNFLFESTLHLSIKNSL